MVGAADWRKPGRGGSVNTFAIYPYEGPTPQGLGEGEGLNTFAIYPYPGPAPPSPPQHTTDMQSIFFPLSASTDHSKTQAMANGGEGWTKPTSGQTTLISYMQRAGTLTLVISQVDEETSLSGVCLADLQWTVQHGAGYRQDRPNRRNVVWWWQSVRCRRTVDWEGGRTGGG